jgi:hypothetical protein
MNVRSLGLGSPNALTAAFFSMAASAVPVTYTSDGTLAPITAFHRQISLQGDFAL